MSDTKELLKAARRLIIDKYVLENGEMMSDGGKSYFKAMDVLAVAKHILSTIRPDDGEPVTDQWLESNGGEWSKQDHYWGFAGQGQTLMVFHIKHPTERWTASVYDENTLNELLIKPDIKTRGSFRNLCKCLGVALKEPAEQASN